MYGWRSCAHARASRRKRSRQAFGSGPDGRITFTATSSPSSLRRATYTSPIPPPPSRPRISYLSSRTVPSASTGELYKDEGRRTKVEGRGTRDDVEGRIAAMLRLRLAANLLFNLLLAGWVYYDARTRGARKPLFAAGLTLLWGPLG